MDTKKLLDLVDSLDIEVGWIKKMVHGTFDPRTHKIRLNPETMMVSVLVHEIMHMIHPLLSKDEDEDIIDELTNRVYSKLTKEQVRKIYKKLEVKK